MKNIICIAVEDINSLPSPFSARRRAGDEVKEIF